MSCCGKTGGDMESWEQTWGGKCIRHLKYPKSKGGIQILRGGLSREVDSGYFLNALKCSLPVQTICGIEENGQWFRAWRSPACPYGPPPRLSTGDEPHMKGVFRMSGNATYFYFLLGSKSLLCTGTKTNFSPHKQVWVELLHCFTTHRGIALSLHGERESNPCLQEGF